MSIPTDMKIRVWQRSPDEWQADLDVGPGHHAIGKTPWEALTRLAEFCKHNV